MLSIRSRTFASLALTLVLAAGATGVAQAARDTKPPTAPANLRTTAVTQTTANFAWNPSTDNVRVTEYALWAPGLPIVRVPGNQTTAQVTGLHPNTSYTFKVQAWDGWNWSFPSERTITTPRETTAPTVPGNLRLGDNVFGTPVDGVTASTALLRWDLATDDFGPVDYEVLVNGAPTDDAWSIAPAGSPARTAQGSWVRQLEPGTTYTFTVRARDGSGNVSAVSNLVTVSTDASGDTVAPTRPTLISAGDGGTSYCPEELWLRWTGSSDDADAATAIEYEVRVNGTIIDVARGATSWITYTDVAGANVVTIVAVDRAGNASAPSNPITVNVQWGTECPA
ncbi:fibronectin type III domain-containing protein [Jiangella alkaliphila]|uniref:Fibronectin type III domain-containing protein n=1 Tax=Jiangella alkaliphila TaxID=419479 RepID=A0A1H2JRK8_9ACTN|nr:fibronectin type III domain-containing protein [Jiangella alkaliphila]SDU59002.1 Fibronectin type III domain-containing protein [Jiangella alkaliphila]